MSPADAAWLLVAALVGLPALVYGIVFARAIWFAVEERRGRTSINREAAA